MTDLITQQAEILGLGLQFSNLIKNQFDKPKTDKPDNPTGLTRLTSLIGFVPTYCAPRDSNSNTELYFFIFAQQLTSRFDDRMLYLTHYTFTQHILSRFHIHNINHNMSSLLYQLCSHFIIFLYKFIYLKSIY